jgi:hypothetical protein
MTSTITILTILIAKLENTISNMNKIIDTKESRIAVLTDDNHKLECQLRFANRQLEYNRILSTNNQNYRGTNNQK